MQFTKPSQSIPPVVQPAMLLRDELNTPQPTAGNADLVALLHTLLQAYNELQLRVGQLEHTERIRISQRPRHDLGIDY